jgi:predicted GNAT family N-acyltransferase
VTTWPIVVAEIGDDSAGRADREAAFAIRRTVFVAEQGVPEELELDDLDATALHVVARLGDRVVGTGRLVREAPGYAGLDPMLGPFGHLGRLAVLAEVRGAGVGAALVAGLEQVAAGHGLTVVALGSQVQAQGFYARLGYQPIGEIFDDAGIDHRMMTKLLEGP